MSDTEPRTADGKVLWNFEQPSFEQGVTMHRYAIRDAKEASSC